jgi:hypothetical protein
LVHYNLYPKYDVYASTPSEAPQFQMAMVGKEKTGLAAAGSLKETVWITKETTDKEI